MFRRLRIKLTVLYAGLFGVALLLISATAYVVVSNNARVLVREQLHATGAVFDRIWQFRSERLQEGVEVSARDYGFRQAVATQDVATVRSALENLRSRLDADMVFLVAPDGRAIGADATGATPDWARVLETLEDGDAASGVVTAGGDLYQTVTAPILAPDLMGWVVVGERLDRGEMRALEQLAAIPLHATVLLQESDGWRAADEPLARSDGAAIAAFVNAAGAGDAGPDIVHAFGSAAMTLTKPLRALDDTRSVLLFRYPLDQAMAPYRTLFSSLTVIGVLGMALLLVATWLLANGITRPLSALEDAARQLLMGQYGVVTVSTNDEIGRLADTFNSMTAAIQQRESQITELALTDSDSGLPNRRSLERRLAARTRLPQGARLYIAAIGLDRFAQVRGAIGYGNASLLVRRLGQRISELVGDAPTARLSTDVLGLAFFAPDDAGARARMGKLQARLQQPLSLDGQVVDIDITIGLAAMAHRPQASRDLIDEASVALDQARAARAKLAFFDEASYGDPSLNLSLMGEMRSALARGEIQLVHQPKFSFRERSIVGVESLVRWPHPRRGMISPDLFVPMAEETGHIRALTDWVLDRAIQDQRRLAEAGCPLQFSVNLSGRLLADGEFVQSALAAVANVSHGLCFEVTETAIIDRPAIAIANLQALSDQGVQVSIDDFGSGLSSLAYLKQLPAHELKIDKLFIQSLTHSTRDALLVRSTIDLAHGLGLKVVAEGVENPAVFALLASMGCDLAQGYLVSRPEPTDELLRILLDHDHLDFCCNVAKSALKASQ